MPTLDWIGKEAVVKHHEDVPYRLLETVLELSRHPERDACPEEDTGTADQADPDGNLIVQGDNLLALKALLPR